MTQSAITSALNGKAASSHTHSTLQISNRTVTFNWNGQSGQPNWLWGGNDSDPTKMYVYNPSNFKVDTARRVQCNPTENKTEAGLFMFQSSTNNDNPDGSWYSIIRTQHPGYTNGWWQELALNFNDDAIFYRRNVNGTKSSWVQIPTFANIFYGSTIIPNGADLTLYQSPGIYQLSGNYQYAPCHYGIMLVMRTINYIVQMIIDTDGSIHTRNAGDSSSGDWKRWTKPDSMVQVFKGQLN